MNDLKNIGKDNTGNNNIGNWNEGSYNIGNGNYEDGNIGNGNYGNGNIGDENMGHDNVGFHNTGICNIGDFNLTNYAIGCFNTETQEIKFFDKEIGMTLEEWREHPACILLKEKFMVDYAMGKILSIEELTAVTEKEKDILRSIPNFDEEKFYRVTGIRI